MNGPTDGGKYIDNIGTYPELYFLSEFRCIIIIDETDFTGMYKF